MRTTSIARKIKLAGQGDREALTELYNELRQPVYLLAYSITRSHALTEGIVQDTFEKLITHSQTYEPTGSARAWILRIAHNTAIDYLRRENRNVELGDSIVDHLDDYAEVESDLDFLKATAALSDRDKSIAVFKVFSGLTHVEIAEALDMTEGAVRVRYRRILKQLRRFYRSKD